MARWWQRAAPTASSEPVSGPSAPAVATTPGWQELAPIQRSVTAMPPAAPDFTPSMVTSYNPSLLGPLGHHLDDAGPVGTVTAQSVSAVQRASGPDLVLVSAPPLRTPSAPVRRLLQRIVSAPSTPVVPSSADFDEVRGGSGDHPPIAAAASEMSLPSTTPVAAVASAVPLIEAASWHLPVTSRPATPVQRVADAVAAVDTGPRLELPVVATAVPTESEPVDRGAASTGLLSDDVPAPMDTPSGGGATELPVAAAGTRSTTDWSVDRAPRSASSLPVAQRVSDPAATERASSDWVITTDGPTTSVSLVSAPDATSLPIPPTGPTKSPVAGAQGLGLPLRGTPVGATVTSASVQRIADQRLANRPSRAAEPSAPPAVMLEPPLQVGRESFPLQRAVSVTEPMGVPNPIRHAGPNPGADSGAILESGPNAEPTGPAEPLIGLAHLLSGHSPVDPTGSSSVQRTVIDHEAPIGAAMSAQRAGLEPTSEPGPGLVSPLAGLAISSPDPLAESPVPERPVVQTFPSLPNVPSLPSLPSAPHLPSVPSLPNLPSAPSLRNLPTLPNLPSVPNLPSASNLPSLPSLPSVPTLPSPANLPSVPSLPGLPGLPDAPTIADVPQSPEDLPGLSSLRPGPVLPDLPTRPTLSDLPGLPSGLPGPADLSGGFPGLPAGLPDASTVLPGLPRVPSLPTELPTLAGGLPTLPAGLASPPAGLASLAAGLASLPAGRPPVPEGLRGADVTARRRPAISFGRAVRAPHPGVRDALRAACSPGPAAGYSGVGARPPGIAWQYVHEPGSTDLVRADLTVGSCTVPAHERRSVRRPRLAHRAIGSACPWGLSTNRASVSGGHVAPGIGAPRTDGSDAGAIDRHPRPGDRPRGHPISRDRFPTVGGTRRRIRRHLRGVRPYRTDRRRRAAPDGPGRACPAPARPDVRPAPECALDGPGTSGPDHRPSPLTTGNPST